MLSTLSSPSTVIFDLGGVLIDWNPRYLYRQRLDDPATMEHFLTFVCSHTWNLMQDAGRPFAVAITELSERYPQQRDLIQAFFDDWETMLAGPIAGSVALLEALDQAGIPLYALTNWSAETFPIARRRFDFLARFRGIVVSGEERLVKPDPALYLILCQRHGLTATDCLFIDDNAANVAAATALGMHGHHFQDSATLGKALRDYKLLTRQ